MLIFVLARQWLEMPAYLLWGLIVLWVGKDVVLFPFLWRFYDPDQQTDRFRMIGRKGFALNRLNPEGYVQVRSERWRAESVEQDDPIEKGKTICVVAAEGLKLTVSACAEDQTAP